MSAIMISLHKDTSQAAWVQFCGMSTISTDLESFVVQLSKCDHTNIALPIGPGDKMLFSISKIDVIF